MLPSKNFNFSAPTTASFNDIVHFVWFARRFADFGHEGIGIKTAVSEPRRISGVGHRIRRGRQGFESDLEE